MEKDRLSRQLAVILHADVVGSTTLVQRNETLAHERIQAAFHHFSEIIKGYGGMVHELRGDALVAEFKRASDAVCAALSYQAANAEFNTTLNDDIQPQMRVGISLGEVVIADKTITGAGVILAQRLEQLAKPGGVVLQGSVSETVPARMPFEFESMGEQKLKGFEQPVRAFTVRLQTGEKLPSPEADAASQAEELNDFQISPKLSPDSYETLTGERLELPDTPSIAVLPFNNMSGDPEQEYFADGMSEDIISTLSRLPELIVIARNSSFAYKGRAIDVRLVGQELGVGHVLEGSIRKSGDRLRITAQLVSTESGDHVWAERYDRILDDIFAIQDEITHNIVVELQAQLVSGDSSLRMTSSTKSVEAWELTTRAVSLIGSHVHDKAIAAKQLIDRALELDKNYSNAWNMLGWIHWEESVWKWSSDPKQSMQMAFDVAQKALSLDVNNPHNYSLLGHIYLVRGDAKQAIAMCEKSIELAPGDSKLLALLANVLVDSGQLKEGIQKIQRAIRLCPYPPAWYLIVLGAGFHLIGENESAVSALQQAVKREPDSHLARVWLASTLAEMGRLDEAQVVSKEVIAIDPAFSALSWADSYRSKSHERLKDNLLAAGLPD
jgi:adenylate cyclase